MKGGRTEVKLLKHCAVFMKKKAFYLLSLWFSLRITDLRLAFMYPNNLSEHTLRRY